MSTKEAPKERGLVTYSDRAGKEITLSFNIVRNYLITGKRELVTDQEIMFFMGICKARGLNPFAKDCYLTKYSPHEGAAIIVAIDFYRARARAQEDFQGYQCGVICQKEDGNLRYSNGLVLKGEEIVGGWFEAQPIGWLYPLKLEVNLTGYIKKKADGSITKFWSPENQPTMIAKVAESQGLRKCWPAEFQGTYTAEERSLDPEILDIAPSNVGEIVQADYEVEEPDAPSFMALLNQSKLNSDMVYAFVLAYAAHSKKTEKEVTDGAVKNWDKFVTTFKKWEKKQTQEAASAPPADDQGQSNGNAPVQEGEIVEAITDDQLAELKSLLKSQDIPSEIILEDYDVSALEKLDTETAAKIIAKLKE